MEPKNVYTALILCLNLILYAASRNVAGSILDEDTGFFN
jgi:hypothetical protein